MIQRVLYLLKFYLLTVVLFLIAKVAFMLANMANHPFSVSDVYHVLLRGVTLDLSTALYFLIVPFLACIASVWVTVPRWIWQTYHVIAALVYSLAIVADTSLYPFWNFKLNASCLQYLDSPTEVMASVSTSYILIRLAVLAVVIAVVVFCYARIKHVFPPVTHRLAATFCALLLIPLMVIGIRGGVGESTTNIGQVYFSQNQFLNHAAVNPVFSFMSSFEKSANDIMAHDYFSPEECDRLMEGLYPTTTEGSDTLLTTQRPNIIIVLMESAGEVMGDAMPRLQQLKEEGINFTACYANSWRTDRGTVCIWSGYPSFPSTSVMKMPSKSSRLPSIARRLQEIGYETSYYYGGDINFTNMRSYLLGTGFARLSWQKHYTSEEQASAKWGVRDDIMFDAVYDKLMGGDGKSPQLIGFSTLSSHEPWDVPEKRLKDPVKNAFYYLDECLGNFIDRLKATPQWQNTLVILLPDHSIDYGGSNESWPERNLIPMVWVGGVVEAPHQVDVLCNQTDLAATLLAQLGLPHDEFLWSRDVLSKNYQYPFAIHNYDNGFSLRDSTGFMLYDLDARQMLVGSGDSSIRLKRMGEAILQATTKDLKEK